MKSRGSIILVSGPSGVGKKTIQDELMKNESLDLHFSVSWTTRKPRAGEVDGVDYHFVTVDEFKKAIRHRAFVEYNKYNNTYYGTPKDNIRSILEKGHNVLLEIDVHGASKVMRKYRKEVISIFIAPPSLDSLEVRLLNRGTESIDVIQNRIKIAAKELKKSKKFDYVVINDSVIRVVNELNVILMERLR